MPTTTPHTMRRTYISIALLANGFDVKWVMSQVGHADSKMTMDVYAQLEQRVDRSHGTAFDELVRRARGQEPDDVRDTFGTPGPPDTPDRASRHRHRGKEKACKRRPFRGGETRTRTGDTTIFSRVLYQLSYLAAAQKASGCG